MQNNVEYILEIKDLMSKKLEAINSSIAKMEGNIAGISKKTNEASSSLMSFGKSLAAAFAVQQIASFGQEVINTANEVNKLNSTIKFTSGAEGEKNLAFLRESVDKYGLPALETAQAFKTLTGSFMGTALAGRPMRDLFTGISSAATAMGMTGEETKGSILALSQMMSKGKVSAEELRGQLGERLPGAFNLAAKAMGVTTSELDKMMDKGQLVATDFLPKFAAELQKTFGAEAMKKANDYTATLNRFNNKILEIKVAVGTMILPQALVALQSITSALSKMITWVSANKEMLYTLAEAVSIAGVAYAAWRTSLFLTTGVLKGLTIWEGIQFTAMLGLEAITNAVTAAQIALNVAWAANPIGIVIAGIIALVGVIKVLYDRFETVRGVVWGVWEAFKGAFGAIFDFLYNTAKAIGDVITGAITGNLSLMVKGVEDLGKNLVTQSVQIGTAAAKGFGEGYQNGIADFRNEKDAEMYAPGTMDSGVGAGYNTGKFSAAGLGMNTKGGKEKSSKDKSLKEAVGTVAGTSNKYVNITIQKLVGIESLVTNNMKESKDMIKRYALQALTEAVTDANAVAGR